MKKFLFMLPLILYVLGGLIFGDEIVRVSLLIIGFPVSIFLFVFGIVEL